MRWIVRGLVIAAVAFVVASAQAELVSDDFNDNSLDAGKWWAVTSAYPGANVQEVNQRIELTGRGYLNTQQQFDPATGYPGGIQITGTWTFVNSDNFMQILTRSDGVPVGAYGETQKGIEFTASFDETFSIGGRGGAAVAGLSVYKAPGFSIDTGDTFAFQVFDRGTALVFTINEVGNSASWATATATCTTDMALDYVVFHNREGASRLSYLDNVLIEQVPEPSALIALLGLIGTGLVVWFRRRS